MLRNVLLVSALFLAGTTPALADPFDWIYGLTERQAAERLERQGFTFDKEGSKEGKARYYYWHRKTYCVKFKSIERIVAEATEVPPRECGLSDDGNNDY